MAFEKGNKLGRLSSRIGGEELEIRKATREQLFKAFNKFIQMNDLNCIDETELTSLEKGVKNHIKKWLETSDIKYVEYMFNQVIGKPLESLDIEANLNVPSIEKKLMDIMSSEDIKHLIEQLEEENE